MRRTFRRWVEWPPASVIFMATALTLFVLADTWITARRRGDLAEVPPIYGRWEPAFSAPAVGLALLVLCLGAAAAWFAVRRPRVPTLVALAGLFTFFLVFAGTVGLVRGDSTQLYDSVRRAHVPEHTGDPDYAGDVPLVRELGIRGAVEAWPDLVPLMASAHSMTHPPGPVVLMAVLEELLPGDPLGQAIVLALLGALVVVPTWVLARAAFGEQAALLATLLLVTAPGPVMFLFTSMDAVFATLLATSAALLAVAVHRRSLGFALGGGGVLAVATFFTYAAVFVAVFGGLYAAIILRPVAAARIVGASAAGGVAVLAVLYILVGFDPFASYAGVPPPYSTDFNYLYWFLATPVAWLLFAGFPAAGLGVRELVLRRAPLLLAGVGPLLVFWWLPADVTRLIPGEVERTWLFAYPFLVASAGAGLGGWRRRRDGSAAIVIVALMLLSGVQAILLEGLVYTYW